MPRCRCRCQCWQGRTIDDDGWLHTGDIGEKDAQGRVFIKGRKKEMIVTPEGLNVFPDDVERALNAQPGVIESAVVGVTANGQERVHAVLVLAPGTPAEAVIRDANQSLLDHQRVRGFSVWTSGELPRTEGTKKLKRQAVRDWVPSGRPARGRRNRRRSRRRHRGAIRGWPAD